MKIYGAVMAGVVFLGVGGLLSAAPALDPYHAGLALYSKGKYTKAISEFQQAIELNPKDWSAYQSLGDCYLKEGYKDAGIQAYNQSLAINPDNPNAQEMTDKIKEANAKEGIATPLAAPPGDGPRDSFYINIGATLPAYPDAFKEAWNIGENFGIQVGSQILGPVSALLDIQYQNFPLSPTDLIGKGGTIHLFTAMACLKIRFVPAGAVLSPYWVGGMGLGYFIADGGSLSDGFTTVTFSGVQESQDLAFRLGLGADIKMQDKVYCTVELDAVGVNREYDSDNPMSFAEGRVGFRFDQ